MKSIKLFWICDHLYEGTVYDLDACPKCFGLGEYKDFKLNSSGMFELVEGLELVKQEVLYLISTELGDNFFYNKYGMNFKADDLAFKVNLDNQMNWLKNQQSLLGRSGDELLDRWIITITKEDPITRKADIEIYLDSGNTIVVNEVSV